MLEQIKALTDLVKDLRGQLEEAEQARDQAVQERDEARKIAGHLFGAFEQSHGAFQDLVTVLRNAYKLGDLEGQIEGLEELFKAVLPAPTEEEEIEG
jgi:hypothetical protein